ncbi:MAG TPA: Uma2 family endonuclease [Terriglobia bacterium]|nr:Uma2 family endonuclease [Terriglobia bacterium]
MATKTALTWEDFLAAGKEGQSWEYVDGEVKFMSPHMGGGHYQAVMKICLEANDYASRHAEWLSVHTDVAFTMTSGSLRCPDWALVRRDRFGEGGIPEGPMPFPPDVAFEVISPSDKWSDIQSKRREYRSDGVIQVWVDLQERTVEVISPKHGVSTFAEGETVTIGELPGFELNLFPPVVRS